MAKIKVTNNKKQATNWLLWAGGGIILAISLINLGLWTRNEIAKWQRKPIEQEIKKWEEVVGKTPTYRDGYLKLATLYWKLHEDEKAKIMIDKAQKIDPNYEGIDKLRKQLGY